MRGDKERARNILQELLHIQPDNQNARQAMEALQ
jgi:hypothetical protein